MWKQSFLKYRGLFISTTLFVFFFILYLIVNYTIQLSTIKDIQYSHAIQKIQSEMGERGLSDTVRKDITTLSNGGVIRLSELDVVTVDSIQSYLPVEVDTINQLMLAISSENETLADKQLTMFNNVVLKKKERSIKLLKTLQIIVAILTLLLYFLVVVQLVLQLSKTDVVEVQSRKETEGIMGTISEGIFLLDKSYQIGAEQSASLKGMFKSEKDLEGHFLDFISSYVTQKNVDLALEYLELLFGDRVKERLVEELNPLKQVEVNIVRRDGSYESHYLDFKFKRVLVDDKVSHLLASVSDVTKQVLLERELNATKEAQEAQLDMLKSILHIDRNKLALFFKNTNDTLHDVNNTLESKGKNFNDDEIRTVLNQISSKIHRIKGDAAALGLHRFEFSSHDLEESISAIKSDNEKITGKDLFPLTTSLRMMFSDLEDLKELVSKFSGVQIAKSDTAEIDNKPPSLADDTVDTDTINIESSLVNLVETVAKRNEKVVDIKVNGLNNQVPEYLVDVVQTIATQCVRNSIVHGIEAPEERKRLGKPENASISINFLEFNKGYLLLIRDDGRGIDEEELLEKAISKNIISSDTAANIPSEKLRNLLFHPGFSTEGEASIDAGRGFGLDVVKKLVDEHQGKMNLTYKVNEFYQFGVIFPVAS